MDPESEPEGALSNMEFPNSKLRHGQGFSPEQISARLLSGSVRLKELCWFGVLTMIGV